MVSLSGLPGGWPIYLDENKGWKKLFPIKRDSTFIIGLPSLLAFGELAVPSLAAYPTIPQVLRNPQD